MYKTKCGIDNCWNVSSDDDWTCKTCREKIKLLQDSQKILREEFGLK
jgi:hypothetical protein